MQSVDTMTVSASGAELRIYSGGAPQDTLKVLAPLYERQSGNKLQFTYAIVGAIQQRLLAGEQADVVLLPQPLLEPLEKTGKLKPGSRNTLARVGIAVVIRDGAPKPDVSTPSWRCCPHCAAVLPGSGWTGSACC